MNETGVKSETELVLRRLSDTFPYASPEANAYCWWALTLGVLALGMIFVAWMYRRDSKSCHWYVAMPLAVLRMGVYALLAFAFLLPAKQTWETSEKRSRVILLIDISPSITQISDEISRSGGPKPKFRIEKVIDFLTDDKVAFLKKLLDRNPVFVYRFGTRLDEDAQSFKADDAAWSTDDWAAWTRYDFKPWVLKVLSPAGRDIITKTSAWNGAEPGTADWAVAWVKLPEAETVPATLTPADSAALKDAIKKLEARVDVARSIIQGTDLPDSLAAAINRESSNMAQAVIVISDGRSNLGSEGVLAKLRDRPGEKIPVFTIAVGEPRENVSIVITDLQVPDRVPPDEPSKILIEADGIGLEKQEVDLKVGLYLPTRDPKKDSPDHEIPAKIKFEPGEPPHGRVEIVIDPDTLPESLTEEVKKDGGKRKQLKQGSWNVVARIPKDKREVYNNEFHVSPPRVLNVIDSPLRVLLWASGPTREYQTLRTMLMREVNEKRAEMSIFLQNSGGADGTIVQDVSPERCLTKFPTRYVIGGPSTPEDKFYNLNEYDLIIAFDPDWSELSPEQIDMTKRWVMDGGGGFIYVAGAINTHQLARADDAGRLKPLLEMMPVLPEDRFLVQARAVPRTPRRALLKPNPDFDILKLDDTDPTDPIAGWETFFTGKAKYTPDPDMKKNLTPTRGFFSYYPVKLLKPGAAVLMEFLDTNDTGVADPKPYLVCSQPGKGRAAFLASGEMYRIRFPEASYYDRFWIRFARAMSSARRNVQSFRGQVLVNKEYTSGSMIRVATRLVAPNNLPYPVNGITPKFKVEQYEGANKIKEFGPFPLSEKKTSAAFDGYYQAQVLADPRQFPAGEYRYKVVVEVPDSSGDIISGEFMVRKSNPELDNTRPDFAALQNAASSLEEIKAGIKNAGVVEKLRGTATNDAQVKMAFKLGETDKLAIIPECIEAKFVSIRNRGAVDDLWDKGFELPASMTQADKRVGGSRTVSYLLLAAVALLGIEWLTRKLVRLA
ncbi:hypothetical protein BH11PLA2_BH11PLA2_03040 [soil metagenome]